MFKWVHYTDNDAISQIDALRKKYHTPTKKYYFKDGMYKDKPCIYVLNDLTTRLYEDPVPSKQFKDDLFFGPLEGLNIDNEEINPDKKEWKIKVDLVCGKTVWIIPASLEPKKLVFDFDDDGVKEEISPFSQATEYGRLAYNIFNDLEGKKPLQLTDQRVKKLIMLGLCKSYNIPIDVWNSLGLVSAQDIDPLLSACLGVNPELLDKKKDG
jgi:hypothetical protein